MIYLYEQHYLHIALPLLTPPVLPQQFFKLLIIPLHPAFSFSPRPVILPLGPLTPPLFHQHGHHTRRFPQSSDGILVKYPSASYQLSPPG